MDVWTFGRSDVSTRAFSLIEVLLAIFILGIGVISIAALFPAGIAQQRRSADDILGPTVANNALEVIRGKVRPDDFGSFLNGAGNPDFDPAFPTIIGDWVWRRPAVYSETTSIPNPFPIGNDPVEIEAGGISIFTINTPGGTTVDSEIPWNTHPDYYPVVDYPNGPLFVITQRERTYPQTSKPLVPSTEIAQKPQYYWECMFRRFQGKIHVAIFVYRVSISGGAAYPYSSPIMFGTERLPFSLLLSSAWDASGPDLFLGNADDAEIDETGPNSTPAFNPSELDEGWQAPGQWIIDQNNNVHRVLSGRLNDTDGPVQLVRPVPVMPGLPVFSSLAPFDGIENIVSAIFYIPPQVELDTDGDGAGDLPVTLTPVYATVKEL